MIKKVPIILSILSYFDYSGLTKSLAREYGLHGIRFNLIAPGFIETDMTHHLSIEQRAKIISKTPLKCFGHPDVCNANCYDI